MRDKKSDAEEPRHAIQKAEDCVRILTEEEVNRKTTRQSIVFFVHPDHETVISPLPTFADDKFDKQSGRGRTKTKEFTNGYASVTALEHVNRRFAATYKY